LHDETGKSPKQQKVYVHSYKDLKMISNTLQAQGVSNLFLQSLMKTEDQDLIKEALMGLSCMKFSCIQESVYNVDNLSRICHLTQNKDICFFPGLDLICNVSSQLL
jgi:hypothetical protein